MKNDSTDQGTKRPYAALVLKKGTGFKPMKFTFLRMPPQTTLSLYSLYIIPHVDMIVQYTRHYVREPKDPNKALLLCKAVVPYVGRRDLHLLRRPYMCDPQRSG